MARVAVRDLEKDSYIFTNRDGIKLRELTVPQLVTLIERDMVDILEHKTSFRETLSASNGQNSLGQSPAQPRLDLLNPARLNAGLMPPSPALLTALALSVDRRLFSESALRSASSSEDLSNLT